jgi:hypothetical protein
MKFLATNSMSRRSRIKFGLAVFSLSLSSAIAVAQQEKSAKPTGTPKATSAPKPAATPKPSPIRETKIDAKMEAELLQAEDRFINAIRNRDAKALSDLLADYYADSFRDAERAINKRGSIERATEGKLPVYRVEKDRKLIRSGNTFTVEGLAKDSRPVLSEENRKEEWVHVRRLWLREGDRWLAIAQIITPGEEKQSEKAPK